MDSLDASLDYLDRVFEQLKRLQEQKKRIQEVRRQRKARQQDRLRALQEERAQRKQIQKTYGNRNDANEITSQRKTGLERSFEAIRRKEKEIPETTGKWARARAKWNSRQLKYWR